MQTVTSTVYYRRLALAHWVAVSETKDTRGQVTAAAVRRVDRYGRAYGRELAVRVINW